MKNERSFGAVEWTNDPRSPATRSKKRSTVKSSDATGLPLPGERIPRDLVALRFARWVRPLRGEHRLRHRRSGIRENFQAMVCGQDVKHGKPNPEVFLLGASKLGMPPPQCVVFEDAHVGIEAAIAGGMTVVGVATTHPPESLRGANRVVRRLDELKLAELDEWFK